MTVNGVEGERVALWIDEIGSQWLFCERVNDEFVAAWQKGREKRGGSGGVGLIFAWTLINLVCEMVGWTVVAPDKIPPDLLEYQDYVVHYYIISFLIYKKHIIYILCKNF